MPFVDTIFMTEVDAAPEGDAFFPELRDEEWTSETLESYPARKGNDHAFSIVRMERQAAYTSRR